MKQVSHEQEDTEARWNVLVTAQEGSARDLKRLVKNYGVFRWSHFRNVLLGWVPEPSAFFSTLAEILERKPFVHNWLGKAVPIAVTLPVCVDSFAQDVENQLSHLLEQLSGKSFYVRVERRGHKGQLHTHALEQQLGDYLWDQLQRRDHHPTVSFNDPDVVVIVEIAGQTAGIGVIPRRLREEFSFIKLG